MSESEIKTSCPAIAHHSKRLITISYDEPRCRTMSCDVTASPDHLKISHRNTKSSVITALNMRVSAVTGQRGEPGIGLNGIESERWWNCMVLDQLMVRRMDPSGRKAKEERERWQAGWKVEREGGTTLLLRRKPKKGSETCGPEGEVGGAREV